MGKEYKFPSPTLNTIDEISVLTDIGLEDLSSFYCSYIARGRRENVDTREWEEELCYIQREQEIRTIRAMTHENWLSENQVDVSQSFDVN